MGQNNKEDFENIQEIDVTIPCWNSERTLDACITGLRRSDIPIKKIFVVDQCSTDRTHSIAESRGATVVTHGGNYTDAILFCAEVAKTEYSLIVDSDIIIASDFFSKLWPLRKGRILVKGIIENYLHKKYDKIVQRDIEYFSLLERCNGFAAVIIDREWFLDVFRKVITPWKGLDASSDSLLHVYCAENDIPCYQDVNVRSLHLVMSLQRLWRSRRWYARTTRRVNIPGLTFSKRVKSPTILWNLIKYRDTNLFLHDIMCYLYWFLGLVGG